MRRFLRGKCARNRSIANLPPGNLSTRGLAYGSLAEALFDGRYGGSRGAAQADCRDEAEASGLTGHAPEVSASMISPEAGRSVESPSCASTRMAASLSDTSGMRRAAREPRLIARGSLKPERRFSAAVADDASVFRDLEQIRHYHILIAIIGEALHCVGGDDHHWDHERLWRLQEGVRAFRSEPSKRAAMARTS